jgi:hypothetical protein
MSLANLFSILKGNQNSGNHNHLGGKGGPGNPGGSSSGGLVYYRGTVPGETKKISTGLDEWDKNLFVTDSVTGAKTYGSSVEKITLKPNAKILKEGEKGWSKAPKWKRNQNMLEWSNSVAKWAKQNNYDGVHFSRQTDIGTIIFNTGIIEKREKE